ncbi:MAG: oligosaccharide flippase family protein [Blastocatellia bacterium]|nr:oligosaccharide flippase family protein [Blastocatellia bacterium]
MRESTTIKDVKPAEQTSDIAKVAGRGTIYITAAKVWFMVSGAGIHFVLPRLMSKEEFGLYQVAVSAVSVINAVVITGTYQTVSKYISQEEEKAGAVKSKALKLQTLVGGGIALGFFLLAPIVADYLNDPKLVNYLRLASLITLAYSFYAVFTGYFNGQKRFLTQAAIDATYSTLKLGLIVSLVASGYGVAGGIGGFALAAGSVLLVSWIVAGKGERRGEVKAGDLLKFQGYLLLFTFVLNLLQKVDLMLIKALSSTDASTASSNAGDYSAAINIANLTYQIVISVTFVIFPLVSQSTFANDRRRTEAYISNTIRYSLMIMALVATLFSANASEVMRVIYPASFQTGSQALSIVAYGMLLFGLLFILTTIISAGGRPEISLAIGFSTLAANAALNAALIPSYGLTGAAIGTTASMLLGTLAGGIYILLKHSALIRWLSALRIAGCALLVYAASLAYSSPSRGVTLIKLAVAALIYIAGLILSRELGREDLAAVKKVVKSQ